MAYLLSDESLACCSIGTGLDFRKRKLNFEPIIPNPSSTIHPGGVFAPECELCALNSWGYRTAEGKIIFDSMLTFFTITNSFDFFVQVQCLLGLLGMRENH